MKLDIKAAIAELVSSVNGASEKSKLIPDTGTYDETKEKAIRDIATRVGFYAEKGPLFDPKGKYLCDDCALRDEPKSCTHVSGTISMQTGSCMIWIEGDEINLPAGRKLTQIEANYAERPTAKGFGCSRCEYGSKAKKPDSEGRPSWCGVWGMHIIPMACCIYEDGKDLKVAPGE